MALRYLLDTSVYSQPIKKKPLASVIERWKAAGEGAFCISAICETEVLYGIHLWGSAGLEAAYRTILKDRFPVVPFDAACAAVYARLQAEAVKTGRTRPAFDLMIAATALSRGLTLATCNPRDFADIPGLRVEDWNPPKK